MAQRSESLTNIERRERKTDEPAIKEREENSREKRAIPACQRSSPRLPISEVLLYATVVIVVYSYATYQLYKASQGNNIINYF